MDSHTPHDDRVRSCDFCDSAQCGEPNGNEFPWPHNRELSLKERLQAGIFQFVQKHAAEAEDAWQECHRLSRVNY
jgi:hypothetical protein